MAENDSEKLAAIHWEGDSRDVLASFPEEVRATLGFALYELQRGERPAVPVRRMQSLGPGVFELKEGDARTWYRVIYLSKVENVIYVVHCFEKQSRKTDQRDLQIAAQRLKRVRQRLREGRRNAEHG